MYIVHTIFYACPSTQKWKYLRIFNPEKKGRRHFLSLLLKQQGNAIPKIQPTEVKRRDKKKEEKITFPSIAATMSVKTNQTSRPVRDCPLCSLNVSRGKLLIEKRGVEFQPI